MWWPISTGALQLPTSTDLFITKVFSRDSHSHAAVLIGKNLAAPGKEFHRFFLILCLDEKYNVAGHFKIMERCQLIPQKLLPRNAKFSKILAKIETKISQFYYCRWKLPHCVML